MSNEMELYYSKWPDSILSQKEIYYYFYFFSIFFSGFQKLFLNLTAVF